MKTQEKFNKEKLYVVGKQDVCKSIVKISRHSCIELALSEASSLEDKESYVNYFVVKAA